MPPEPRARLTFPLVTITLLAALLRLPSLGAQSLWLDESASFVNAHLLAGFGMPVMAEADHLPPLSFALQALSMAVLGDTEFAIRLPSALAGIAATWLTGVAAYRIVERRSVALIAALLMAVSPFAIWYSQEGRMYALMMLLAVAYVLIAWPLTQGRLTLGRWVALTLVTAAGLWTHHYFGLIAPAMGLYLLVSRVRRKVLVGWLLSQVVAGASFVPWLVMAHARTGGFAKGGQLLWVPYSFFAFVAGHSLGPTVSELRELPAREALLGSVAEVALTGLLLLAIAVVGVGALWRTSRQALVWLAIWLGVPMVLASLAPLLLNISFNVRYVIVAFPALVIVWAAACAELLPGVRPVRRVAGAVVSVLTAVVVLWSLVSWYADPRQGKEDVRSLAAVLKTEVEPGDTVILGNGRVQRTLAFYGRECGPEDVVIYAADGAEAVSAGISRETPAPGRTWLVTYRPWESDPDDLIGRALDERGARRLVGDWTGVRLTVHEGAYNPEAVPQQIWRGCIPCQPAEVCEI